MMKSFLLVYNNTNGTLFDANKIKMMTYLSHHYLKMLKV